MPSARSDSGPVKLRPMVSIVVIFKDPGEFLSEAIESVHAQTFPTWELLLVDDGSTDGSSDLARGLAEDDPARTRYFEHESHANQGMSASRNLGIAHARGDFVAFLDADDELVPTAIEEEVAILQAHPRVGMVYGLLEYWYGWTGQAEDEARDFVHPVGVEADQIYEPPDLISLFIQNIAFAPSGMLLRRNVVLEVGGFEESFRDLYEDQVFAAKICRATPVYISGRCWYRYRQHPDSCCLTAERDGRLDASREPFLRWLLAYLEQEGLAGGDAWQLVVKELRRRSTGGRALARLVAGGRRAQGLVTRLGGTAR
jgi:glycosyltransferase involved in cell wall biosynthesis